MRRSRKIVLLLIILIALSQIPFAYRRYRLYRLDQAIQLVNAERKSLQSPEFVEYKGVVHVHSFLGGHSSGTFSDIIAAAQANGLQFVVMTEHVEKEFDTATQTLSGNHGGILFINGNEVSTQEGIRLLILPGEHALAGADKTTTKEVIRNAKARNATSILAYPEEHPELKESADAVEIYNVYTNARRINPLLAFFDALWSQRRYPALVFANYYQRPAENLKQWDDWLATTRMAATAGNDAHANIGVSLVDSSGKTLLGIKLDEYQTSFQLVRLHVLIPGKKSLDTSTLLESIRAGHSFIGFDFLGDSTGFSFEANTPSGIRIQGDEITWQPGMKLTVRTPVSSRIVLFRNGNKLGEASGVAERDFPVEEKGVYRVEVYLPQLGQTFSINPWIISNPIFVR